MPISLLAIARAAAATAGATANGDATILVAKPMLFPTVLVESRTVLGPRNTPFNILIDLFLQPVEELKVKLVNRHTLGVFVAVGPLVAAWYDVQASPEVNPDCTADGWCGMWMVEIMPE
jgi:hypothetical protein